MYRERLLMINWQNYHYYNRKQSQRATSSQFNIVIEKKRIPINNHNIDYDVTDKVVLVVTSYYL